MDVTLTFTAHAVYLLRLGIKIPSPQGIQSLSTGESPSPSVLARIFSVILANTDVGHRT